MARTCYIESFRGGGFCGEEAKLVGAELASRPGWTVVPAPRENAPTLRRTDLAIGSPDFVRRALAQLGVAAPAPPDYPAALAAHLHRSVRASTLGAVAALFAAAPATRLFVKPARDAKAFNGELLSGADEAGMWLGMWQEAHGEDYPVHTSEPLDILVEHRVYCLRGEVVGVGHYGRSAPEGCPGLDMATVRAAARALHASAERLEGCALDWGVARSADGGSHFTVLVEANDGLFTGFYEGVSRKDFAVRALGRPPRSPCPAPRLTPHTPPRPSLYPAPCLPPAQDMCIARWDQVVGLEAAAAPGAAAGASAAGEGAGAGAGGAAAAAGGGAAAIAGAAAAAQ
jgi:hypothetical protein